MSAPTPAPRLNGRDIAILAGYARGLTTAAVADDLGIRRTAVWGHTRRMAKRLGVTGARQAALVDYAYRHGHLTAGRRRRLPQLPPRMAEILDCAARGLGYRATAAELGISPHTVRSYRDRLHSVLGVHTTAHAVARAWEAGLMTSEQPHQQGDRP